MNKFLYFLAAFLLLFGSATFASANLIQNPGFEDNNAWSSPTDFDYWSEFGNYGITSTAYEGSFAARVSTDGTDGYLTQNLFLPESGTYEYGVWAKIRTASSNNDPQFNTDILEVTTNIAGHGSESISESVASLYSGTTWDDQGWALESDWLLLTSTFTISAPAAAEFLLGITQNETYWSSVYFDNAFVQKASPVPEPATMLLLGSGLVGLAGFSRKKFFKK